MRRPYLVKDVVPIVSAGKKNHVGVCTHCGKAATKEAHFRQEGLVVVERYCDSCLERDTFERLQAVYARFD